jgi:CheY-like chemotaxis protein
MAEPLSGIRVVIAEDHDDTRAVFKRVLEHLGATVTAVAFAGEALSMVGVADIIITDLTMPDKDGVWLLEQVNTHPHPVPVVVMSGFAASQVPRLAQAEFARRLMKPFDPWDLSDVILEVIRGRS